MIKLNVSVMSIKRRVIIGSLLAPQHMLGLSSRENMSDSNNPPCLSFTFSSSDFVLLVLHLLFKFLSLQWRSKLQASRLPLTPQKLTYSSCWCVFQP